jgi:hypothetical protein
MRKFISLAFAGITAGMIALFGATAQASTAKVTGDCARVAKADRKLCTAILRHHSYGAVLPGGGSTFTPNGRALVHELTHQGLTKTELHAGLRAIDADYRANVTAVPVNMDALVRKCGNTDGRYVVSYQDADGHPGGLKLTHVVAQCA